MYEVRWLGGTAPNIQSSSQISILYHCRRGSYLQNLTADENTRLVPADYNQFSFFDSRYLSCGGDETALVTTTEAYVVKMRGW